MSIKKDRVMQELQRFGGAMYTPVILFAFFGLTVAISIVCKNTMLLGSIADKGTVWYDFWFVVEQGAWTVFAQMPILFAIAVPIGFAKKEPARCAMETFVIYMCFNYFISGFLTLHGSFFGVDYSQAAGAGTGLAMIANIKTLDMGMLGAIFIACCSAWIHNHFYDTEIPDWLGIFKGPAFVVAVEAKAAADPSEPVKTDLSMKLKAFASGKLIDMTEVPDDVFSQKMMGDGVAIEPTTEMVVAPADGEVTMIMEGSYHAIGLRLTNGAEILIHIGLDTVKMGGKGFRCLTKTGAKVKAGDELIGFNREAIKAAGYKDTIILAVTNSGDYPQMKKAADGDVKVNETPIISF